MNNYKESKIKLQTELEQVKLGNSINIKIRIIWLQTRLCWKITYEPEKYINFRIINWKIKRR